MKSVYTGGEKVAEFENYDELRVGANKPAFIYEGNELVYPSPIKEGLVLWYDFSGRANGDAQRGVAEDLSGNGNHGTLQNFNFTEESGYDKNKLLFDGVDDYLQIPDLSLDEEEMSVGINGDFYVYSEGTTKTIDTSGDIKTGKTNLISMIPENWEVGGLWTTGRLSGHNDRIRTKEYIPLTKGETYSFYDESLHVSAIESMRLSIYDDDTFVELKEISRGQKLTFQANGNQFKIGLQPMSGLSIPLRFLVDDDNRIKMKLEEGSEPTFFTPSPKDYITTSLSPSSIRNLQLYNRALTDEELLHNYAIEKGRFGIE